MATDHSVVTLMDGEVRMEAIDQFPKWFDVGLNFGGRRNSPLTVALQ